MDPQQELFSYLLVTLKKEYQDMVFDGFMPPEGTPYPFIYLADSQQIDDYGNKTAIFNNVYQTIHVWNDSPKKRGTVSTPLMPVVLELQFKSSSKGGKKK